MDTWKSLENKKKYSILLLVSILTLLSGLLITVQYVPRFETREGFVPYDPFMDFLPARDVSTMVFFVLYAAVFGSFIWLMKHPRTLALYILSFGIMYWIRTLCITLVAFNEPANLIPLADPFIEMLGIYQAFVKRDLFFSGHFASVYLGYLAMSRVTKWSWLWLVGCVLIGIGVMVQHIHFSYDIIGAIVFSWLSVKIAQWMIDRCW
jgi:membrane-associated phospholipid phosphatase